MSIAEQQTWFFVPPFTRRQTHDSNHLDLHGDNLSPLNVKSAYLSRIRKKESRRGNHEKLVSKFERKQRAACRCTVPLNREIIIVPIFILQFCSHSARILHPRPLFLSLSFTLWHSPRLFAAVPRIVKTKFRAAAAFFGLTNKRTMKSSKLVHRVE